MHVLYNVSTDENTGKDIRAVALDSKGLPVTPRFIPDSKPGATFQLAFDVVATEHSYTGDNPSVLEFFSRTPEDDDYTVFYDKETDKLTPLVAKLHPKFVAMVQSMEITDTARAFFQWVWTNFVNSVALVIEQGLFEGEELLATQSAALDELLAPFSPETESIKNPPIISLAKGYTTEIIYEDRCLFPIDGKMCSVYIDSKPGELAIPGGVNVQGTSLTEDSSVHLNTPLQSGDVFYIARLLIPILTKGDDKSLTSVLMRIAKYEYGQSMDLTGANITEGEENVLPKESPSTPE